jgi:serine/threonine protein phosphatase PrpC
MWPLSPAMQAFALSDVGLVRSGNEDAYAVVPSFGFFAVADGMGGHAAGEVASWMAIDAVRSVIEDPSVATAGLHRLAGAVEYANAVVHAASRARGRAGMGTTFTGLLLQDGRAFVAHVGDSRAYLLRGGRLAQLTFDHTLVAARVQAGFMTPEEAAASPRRHIILRAVGTRETLEVDTRELSMQSGDRFLLSSDGLHDVLGDDNIKAVLMRERDVTAAAAELVALANDGGGPDNVTAVLVRIE